MNFWELKNKDDEQGVTCLLKNTRKDEFKRLSTVLTSEKKNFIGVRNLMHDLVCRRSKRNDVGNF